MTRTEDQNQRNDKDIILTLAEGINNIDLSEIISDLSDILSNRLKEREDKRKQSHIGVARVNSRPPQERPPQEAGITLREGRDIYISKIANKDLTTTDHRVDRFGTRIEKLSKVESLTRGIGGFPNGIVDKIIDNKVFFRCDKTGQIRYREPHNLKVISNKYHESEY